MVTETDRNKARSAVVSAYHALDCVTVPFSFLHAFADAEVDAVSTDAEPVTGRNDEAGYVEFLNEDVPYTVRDIDGRCAILVDLHTRKYIGYRVYDPDSDFGSHASNAEPVKTAPAVAEEIADAVLSWMVNYDLLDAGNEYQAVDVLAVLNDLTPACHSRNVESLKWVDHPNTYPAPTWSAQTPFGFYSIEEIPASDSPAYEVRLHAHKLISVVDGLPEAKAAAQADYEARIISALSAQVPDARSDGDEEIYEIGVREGYERAVQEIDIKTGGDGEYRYCTDHDPERHTPGPVEMIQRIVDRFETLNLIGEAEKRGDFWDIPGSAQVQDVAVPEGWQLVPTEPTHSMIRAMSESKATDDEGEYPCLSEIIDFSGENKTHTALKAAYRAMLAASPASKHGDAE